MKLWGQVDLKPILVTVISSALIGAFGYIWSRVEKVNTLETRIISIEATQEQILDLLKGRPPKKR